MAKKMVRKRVILTALCLGLFINQFMLYESNKVLSASNNCKMTFINGRFQCIDNNSYVNNSNVVRNDYSTIDQKYQDYEQFCNNILPEQDPRLVNQGYYINPADIAANRDAQTSMDLISASGGRPSIKLETPEERAQRLYEAQVANQYGVPYAQVQAAQQEKMRCLNALRRSQMDFATIMMMKNNGATNAEIVRFAEINAINNHSYALQNQNMNVNVNHSGTVNTNVYHSGSVDVNHSGTINHNVNQNVNLNGTMYHRW